MDPARGTMTILGEGDSDRPRRRRRLDEKRRRNRQKLLTLITATPPAVSSLSAFWAALS